MGQENSQDSIECFGNNKQGVNHETGPRFCPNCGAVLQPHAHFCIYCGYKIPVDTMCDGLSDPLDGISADSNTTNSLSSSDKNESDNQQASSLNEVNHENIRNKFPNKKKKNILIGIISVIFAIVIVLVTISKDNQEQDEALVVSSSENDKDVGSKSFSEADHNENLLVESVSSISNNDTPTPVITKTPNEINEEAKAAYRTLVENEIRTYGNPTMKYDNVTSYGMLCVMEGESLAYPVDLNNDGVDELITCNTTYDGSSETIQTSERIYAFDGAEVKIVGNDMFYYDFDGFCYIYIGKKNDQKYLISGGVGSNIQLWQYTDKLQKVNEYTSDTDNGTLIDASGNSHSYDEIIPDSDIYYRLSGMPQGEYQENVDLMNNSLTQLGVDVSVVDNVPTSTPTPSPTEEPHNTTTMYSSEELGTMACNYYYSVNGVMCRYYDVSPTEDPTIFLVSVSNTEDFLYDPINNTFSRYYISAETGEGTDLDSGEQINFSSFY